MNFLTLRDIDLKGKKVLVRVDFNVPITNKKVTSNFRIVSAIPTIKYILDKGGAVILMSHLGRPIEGKYDYQFSLEPVVSVLSEIMNHPVIFSKDWLKGVDIKFGEIVICENVRFNKGEKEANKDLSYKISNLGDVFVIDAFATAHRAEASTYGVAEFMPVVCAGLLFDKEFSALKKVFKAPKKPIAAIIGGSKVSTKLMVLYNLLNKVDILVVGGGIANTFLKAKGYNIGSSLYEEALIPEAKNIIKEANLKGVSLLLPIDIRVALKFDVNSKAVIKDINNITHDEMILDIGPKSEEYIKEYLRKAGTIIWNGPIGVFEFNDFTEGTKAIAITIASSNAFSLVGGGDTIAAIEKFDIIKNKFSYISTAGGAFLELLKGKKLYAVDMLIQKAKK